MSLYIDLDTNGTVDAIECPSTFFGWADTEYFECVLCGEFTVLPTIVPDLVILFRKGSHKDEEVNRIATDLLRRKTRKVYGQAFLLQGKADGKDLRGMDFNRASHWCCALRGWEGGV